MTIKYHFFGKECLIDRAIYDFSNLNYHLEHQGFVKHFQPLFLDQIHSNNVLVIDNENKAISYLASKKIKADAVVSNVKNLTISLFTADCAPVLFFDEQLQVVGLAHCGWRGALNGVVQNTIQEMVKIGAKIDNIKAFIGPTIRQKSYEVSQEFYNNFLIENKNNQQFFVVAKKVGHFMFDLPQYIKAKILTSGVKEIFDNQTDTYSNPEQFFSYRRSFHLGENDCGRNISVAQIISL